MLISQLFRLHSFVLLITLFKYVYPLGAQPPILKCPDNYVQSGKACLNIQYSDMILHCPKGSVLEGQTCLTKKFVPAIRRCPGGYKETRDNQCEKEIHIAPLMQCDKDYILSRGMCSKTKRVEPELQCPPGYNLERFTCSRVVTTPAKLSCPSGTTLVKAKSACERVEYMEPILECPKSFMLSESGTCVKEIIKPSTRTCDKGFYLEGNNCVRNVEVGESFFVCPSGTPKGSRCLVSDIQPGSLVCRKDAELEHGRCVERIIEDPLIVCDQDQRVSSKGDCELKREVPGKFHCPPGSILQQKKCITVETKPLLEYCPDGYEEIRGEKCIQRYEEYPQFECPKHYQLRDGQCHSIIQVHPEPFCPPSTVFHNNICKGIDLGEAKYTCQRGKLENGFCIDNLIKPVRLSCPPGYQRDEQSCIAHSYSKPESFCENGELRGSYNCEYTSVVEPTKVCPKGFSIGLSKKCQKTDATEAKATCSYGMRLERGVCVMKK